MIGEGKRGGEIGRAGFGGAVDAGLEGVALAAAKPLRHAPVGAAAGKGEAHHAVAREVIVEAAGEARGGGGEVVAPGDGGSPDVLLPPP